LIDFKNYCSDGTVPSIGESQISSIKVVLPPLEQQHQIVQFLDEKTELIDKLISTKERKITLLKEQRTSVINQIVTKGLNPNVKMKDSGVEWIGEIPEHWRFIKFSYLIIKSDLGGNYESSTENDGVPLIKMGNLGRGKVNLNKVEYLNESEQYDKNHILEFGDFLFNTRNSVDLVGKVSLWRRELDFSLYNSNILRIKFKEGVENEFMCYLFNSQSLLDVLKLISKGTTSVSGIYFKDLSEIKIPIPKLEEQLQIVEHLDSKTKEIDDLVSLEQRKIDLLKEYRQSLISEVVTGKIKVTTDE
jgi:type I restriction enzyme S subunit